MRVGIVGAGVAGLCTAKILSRLGHEVTVWDRTPDVGGVWSRTRRYPGLSTQSVRDTYAFSDFPMPRDYPEWPSGEQVQQYLEAYVRHFGLKPLLGLGTEVRAAEPADGGWRLTLRSVDSGDETATTVDHLVVANGVFCEPNVPALPGRDEFAAAGGRFLAASDFHDVDDARDRHVVVIGYGKSACDVAVAASEAAAATTVVARSLVWKVPRHVAGVLNFKHLLLTRLGESLFRYARLRGFEKFLHGPADGVRDRILASLGGVSTRQFKLDRLGLVPPGRFPDIVRGAIGLSTDGFFDRVADGGISVRRERSVARLLEKDGSPHVELDDGSVVRADLVVAATGYTQGVPFLDDMVQARIRDERGNFMLYRQIHPVDVPDLSFAGYNSSFFSPLNAEMAAVWIAARLAGDLELPSSEAMRAQIGMQLAFMDDAVSGHHCHNTKIIPFSLHNVDEVLDDLGLDIGRGARLKQWLGPVDPSAYSGVAARLQERT